MVRWPKVREVLRHEGAGGLIIRALHKTVGSLLWFERVAFYDMDLAQAPVRLNPPTVELEFAIAMPDDILTRYRACLEADFAKDTSPEAIKTTREINVFCDIDVALEGAVKTLKGDQEKLAAAVKKKDRSTEQMYAATVKDGCSSIRKQLEGLAIDKIDGEPKVAALKAEVDPICTPPSAAKKK